MVTLENSKLGDFYLYLSIRCGMFATIYIKNRYFSRPMKFQEQLVIVAVCNTIKDPTLTCMISCLNKFLN